jgi:hypothetical protein
VAVVAGAGVTGGSGGDGGGGGCGGGGGNYLHLARYAWYSSIAIHVYTYTCTYSSIWVVDRRMIQIPLFP